MSLHAYDFFLIREFTRKKDKKKDNGDRGPRPGENNF